MAYPKFSIRALLLLMTVLAACCFLVLHFVKGPVEKFQYFALEFADNEVSSSKLEYMGANQRGVCYQLMICESHSAKFNLVCNVVKDNERVADIMATPEINVTILEDKKVSVEPCPKKRLDDLQDFDFVLETFFTAEKEVVFQCDLVSKSGVLMDRRNVVVALCVEATEEEEKRD